MITLLIYLMNDYINFNFINIENNFKMVASYLFLTIDIICFLVYFDLWFLNTYKKHVYTPLLYFLPKEHLKKI